LNQIRLLLVALLAVALTIFAVANWQQVYVKIWPQTVLALPLPLLILIILGVVYVPMSIFLRAQKMILKNRISKLEDQIATTESQLAQAKVELLRPMTADPPVPQAIPQALPPPGT
jgi:uncharacterized integral membrane protein